MCASSLALCDSRHRKSSATLKSENVRRFYARGCTRTPLAKRGDRRPAPQHAHRSGGMAVADAMRGTAPAAISTLDLYACGLTDRGAAAVLHMLLEQPGCTQLDLGANSLSHAAAAALAPLLQPDSAALSSQEDEQRTGIATLRLARNAIERTALTPMLSPARANMGLLSLGGPRLSFNPLGEGGGAHLGTCPRPRPPALPHNPAAARLRSLRRRRRRRRQGAGGSAPRAARRPERQRDWRRRRRVDRPRTPLEPPRGAPPRAESPRGGRGPPRHAQPASASPSGKARHPLSLSLCLASNRPRARRVRARGRPRRAHRRRLRRQPIPRVCRPLRQQAGPVALLALGDAAVANARLTSIDLTERARIDGDGLAALATLTRHNHAVRSGGRRRRSSRRPTPPSSPPRGRSHTHTHSGAATEDWQRMPSLALGARRSRRSRRATSPRPRGTPRAGSRTRSRSSARSSRRSTPRSRWPRARSRGYDRRRRRARSCCYTRSRRTDAAVAPLRRIS